MRKKIGKQLVGLLVVGMFIILLVNYLIQVETSSDDFTDTAMVTLDQINIILNDNEIELEMLTASLKESYIIRAQAVAHIVELIDTQTPAEYKEMALALEIDEIHLFDTDGLLYAGSNPEYFNYTFNSGEQMQYFLPMLSDKSLSLCQDITPNTAEGKSMIYAAVWRSDGKGIVQIGLEPYRLIEAQESNEISNVLADIRANEYEIIYAIDRETDLIVGCTVSDYVGLEATSIGIDLSTNTEETSFSAKVDGVESICYFERYNEIYIGVSEDNVVRVNNIKESMVVGFAYMGIAVIFIMSTVLYLIERNFLHDFNGIIVKLDKISNGNLDIKLDLDSSEEFVQLSKHFNEMVDNLQNNMARISNTLEVGGVEVGLYEYKEDMQRVLGTSKLKDLFKVDISEMKRLLSDKQLFEAKIRQIKRNPEDKERHIYKVSREIESYVKIETFRDLKGEHGIIIDVTEDVLERNQLKYQRDHDEMTELLNRRGFYKWMDVLTEEKNEIKNAIIMIIDTDGLKMINDNFGHHKGDLAIQRTAEVLKRMKAPHKIMARLGGDEFVAVLYGMDGEEQIQQCIDEIKVEMSNLSIEVLSKNLTFTISIGYAHYTKGGPIYNTVLKWADEALLEAKSSGKAKVVEYKEP